MGTAASVDSPKVQEGVAFPKQDGDDDVLVDLQPGTASIPNKPVHRDTKFFLDALMDDEAFENALVKKEPSPATNDTKTDVHDTKKNDAPAKVTAPEEDTKISEEEPKKEPPPKETKSNAADAGKAPTIPPIPEPKMQPRYTMEQGEKFSEEVLQDVVKLKAKLAEPPAKASKRVTKKSADGKDVIYETREDGSTHVRFSEVASRTQFPDRSTIETTQTGGIMYSSGDGKKDLQVNKEGITRRSGTAFDATIVSDPRQGILDRDDNDGYTTQWDFRQKVIVERHPTLGTIETHPDKVVHIFPDGMQLCLFKNGNKMVFHKDGTVVQYYPDGTVMKKNPDSSTIQFNPDGMTIESDTEGGRKQTNPDGTVIQIFKDGSRKTNYPNGSIMVSSAPPNITHTTTFADGTVAIRHPDGRVEQTSPDGSKIVTEANGKKTEYHADGSVVEHSPVGSLPGIKVKGPASASSLKSPASRSKEPTPTSNAAASRPKKAASHPKEASSQPKTARSHLKEGASHSNPKALGPITTASRPDAGSRVNAAASRNIATAAASKPEQPAARPEESDDDLGSDEIDSPEGNAKTLYDVMDQPTRALKIVNKREIDLDWRNQDDKGNTVIMMACKVGTPQIVKLLVEKKADVNYANTRRTTPLHVACRRGHTQIATILLDAKANPLASSKSGTPLYEAQKKSHKSSTQKKRTHLLKVLGDRLRGM